MSDSPSPQASTDGKYLTSPVPSTEMPKGIPYIVGNEAAERFSYYGLLAIIAVFLTNHLRNSAGELARFPDPLGRSALETAMIESSGNGYLRRKAAQAIRDSVPREEACELFRYVLEREADINFAIFMRNMIDLNCR